jgi:hypothetical protein
MRGWARLSGRLIPSGCFAPSSPVLREGEPEAFVPLDPSTFFSIVNGRQVYDNGLTKLWRCPECKWWREWEEKQCCACKLLRDDPSPAVVRAVVVPAPNLP